MTLRKRPVTIDDLLAIRMISAPHPSPDDKLVAYSITELDREANEERATLWLHDLETGQNRPLTRGNSKDGSPVWSPDGEWIVFQSTRSGNGQLWAIRPGGGEAVQLTDLDGGVDAQSWSPDGRHLVFTSRVGPKAPEENEPRVVTSIRYRFDGEGYLNDQHQQLFVMSFDPSTGQAGEPRQLTDGPYEDRQPAWSPSGEEVAFRAARFPGWELDVLSDIWTIRLDGSGPRKITYVRGAWSNPIWTADGTELLILGPSDLSKAGYANVEIWRVPSAGGEPVSLMGEFDRSVGDQVLGDVPRFQYDRVVLSPIDQSIHFLASDFGNSHIFRIEQDGTVQRVVGGERRIGSFNILADGRIVFSAGTPTDPGDLFICCPDGSDERRLTDVNAEWRGQVELAEPEELWTESADGTPIQGWILRPPGVDRDVPLPMTVQLHGGPLTQYGNGYMHEFQVLAGMGYTVLYGNPRGSTGYGEAFAGMLIGGWGEADQPDVMALIDSAIDRGGVDPSRIGVLGGSYGGILTNWLLGHSDRFKAAVTMRSCSNFISMSGTDDISFNTNVYTFGVDLHDDPELYWRLSPITYVSSIDTPLLIIHSEQDYRCPIEQAEQLFTALKRMDRTVEFVRFPNASHGLSRSGSPRHRIERLEKIADWFGRWL